MRGPRIRSEIVFVHSTRPSLRTLWAFPTVRSTAENWRMSDPGIDSSDSLASRALRWPCAMSRTIDLGDNELIIRYSGLSEAAVLRRELRIPYDAIRSVETRVDALPGTFCLRAGVSTAPLGDTRRGTFWWHGRRFYDLNDPDHAVLLDLSGHHYSHVVLGADLPEQLADEIRRHLRSSAGD